MPRIKDGFRLIIYLSNFFLERQPEFESQEIYILITFRYGLGGLKIFGPLEMNIYNFNEYDRINEIMRILGEIIQNSLPLYTNTNTILVRNFPINKLISIKTKFPGWGLIYVVQKNRYL